MPVIVYTEVEIQVGDTWTACNGEEIKIIKKNDPVGENSHPTYGGRGETTKEYRQYYHDGHTTIDGYTVFDLKELKSRMTVHTVDGKTGFFHQFKSMRSRHSESYYAENCWFKDDSPGTGGSEGTEVGSVEMISVGQVEEWKEKQPEYTGGSVSYYSVLITNPTTPGRQPYIAECNDIIEALGMSYAEGNALKALWRMCAAKNLGLAKRGYDDTLYDSEKVVFFGQRLVEKAKDKR